MLCRYWRKCHLTRVEELIICACRFSGWQFSDTSRGNTTHVASTGLWQCWSECFVGNAMEFVEQLARLADVSLIRGFSNACLDWKCACFCGYVSGSMSVHARAYVCPWKVGVPKIYLFTLANFMWYILFYFAVVLLIINRSYLYAACLLCSRPASKFRGRLLTLFFRGAPNCPYTE